MSQTKTNKKVVAVISVVLAALLIAAGILYVTLKPKTVKGDKTITVGVVYADTTSEAFTINTDAEFLADAMVEKGLITYDDSGMYTTINGVTADYNADGAWWCVKKDGQMTTEGMNTQPIADGDSYEAVYTIGYEF